MFLLPPVEAQEKKRAAFYQGTSVGAEVFGLMNKALGSDFKSAEAIVQINLKNRYMPVAEIGYGTTDVTNDKTNIHYKATSPYVRIGHPMWKPFRMCVFTPTTISIHVTFVLTLRCAKGMLSPFQIGSWRSGASTSYAKEVCPIRPPTKMYPGR